MERNCAKIALKRRTNKKLHPGYHGNETFKLIKSYQTLQGIWPNNSSTHIDTKYAKDPILTFSNNFR